MWFLMGVDGPAEISPVRARNLLLGQARKNAIDIYNSVKDLPPAKRRDALRVALDAFRPGAADRVERTAKALIPQMGSAVRAFHEAIARELAAMTMTMLTKGTHETVLQGLADAWLDLRDRMTRGDGLSGVWDSIKSAGKATLKVAGKVAKGVYGLACSKVGKLAGPIVGGAAGGKKVGAGIATVQSAACGGGKKRKSAPPPMVRSAPAPRPPPPAKTVIAPRKNNLPLYLALGGAAVVLAILATRSSPAPSAPMVITTAPRPQAPQSAVA